MSKLVKWMCALVAVVVMGAGGPAYAGFYTGNKLYSMLIESSKYSEGVAVGYIAGVFDFADSASVCSPDNVTLGQLKDMTKQYLANNPSRRHDPAFDLIFEMLRATWPCNK